VMVTVSVASITSIAPLAPSAASFATSPRQSFVGDLHGFHAPLRSSLFQFCISFIFYFRFSLLVCCFRVFEDGIECFTLFDDVARFIDNSDTLPDKRW
jgi:hypothetical protein